ncbi:MAG: LPS export ABC transporter periplasmic protein LptC, partial [Bacteroidales bacterium]|nr:LPS export ABC transporter periplasmic protein LptC [Candidatus Latescibacterota bacterium]
MKERLPDGLFRMEGTLFGRSDRNRIGSGTGRTVRRRVFIFPLVIFMMTVLVVSCDESGRQEHSMGTGVLADQEFADFVTMESDSGVVQWKLEAPVARVYDARNLLVTDQPIISFFDETGEISSVLTADKAEYNKISHDLTALGNVVVTSREGYVLETES